MIFNQCDLVVGSLFHIKMERALRNVPPKRVFGRDITNIDPRRPKNASISQKPALASSARQKSHSAERKVCFEGRQAVGEYQGEIVSWMVSRQGKQQAEMSGHVSAEMRQILLDWLVDVHLSFQLKEQTLFLALYYLNAYSAVHDITKHEYQLVGITCLWIASKYEEIYPPRMRNYVDVTDSSYSTAELKAMEGRILLALHFNLTRVTPLSLLQPIAERWPKDKDGKKHTIQAAKTLNLCKYLLELSLFQNLGKKYCSKTLVVGAVMLADSILKTKSDSRLLEGVERETLMGCFKDMCTAMQNATRPNAKHRAIRKKYSHQRYLEVAKFRIQPK